jgi:hypothetical protein
MAAPWTVQAQFAIEAADEQEALAIGQAVFQQLDAPLTDPLHARQSRQKVWTITGELDLSGLPMIEPDTAHTRIAFLKRNLGEVTWRVARTDDLHEAQEWPPGFWAERPEADDMLVHPAVRAALIQANASGG